MPASFVARRSESQFPQLANPQSRVSQKGARYEARSRPNRGDRLYLAVHRL